MIDYYTMESVRKLIDGKYDVKSTANPVPLPSWNRYPCPVFEKCKNGKCVGYVSIYINNISVRWINIEICFFKEKQRAFIRAGSLQMQKLIELGIVSEDLLIKDTF